MGLVLGTIRNLADRFRGFLGRTCKLTGIEADLTHGLHKRIQGRIDVLTQDQQVTQTIGIDAVAQVTVRDLAHDLANVAQHAFQRGHGALSVVERFAVFTLRIDFNRIGKIASIQGLHDLIHGGDGRLHLGQTGVHRGFEFVHITRERGSHRIGKITLRQRSHDSVHLNQSIANHLHHSVERCRGHRDFIRTANTDSVRQVKSFSDLVHGALQRLQRLLNAARDPKRHRQKQHGQNCHQHTGQQKAQCRLI